MTKSKGQNDTWWCACGRSAERKTQFAVRRLCEPRSALERIRPLTESLIVLLAPSEIGNLADYYDDFGKLSGDEVANCVAARHKALAELAVGKTAA